MGSLFKPKSPPPPPPPPPPPTVRDEIGGVEQVAVKNSDGTTTYVTRRIPLTVEEQAEKDALDSILKDALNEIERLSADTYEADENTQKRLFEWESEKQKLLTESFEARATAEEKNLARRGLGDSSAAQAIRRRRRLDEQEALEQVKREKDSLGDDIRSQKLSLQQNLYNVAASQASLDQAKTLQSAARGQSAFATFDNLNRASIADYYNQQVRSSQFGQPSLFSQVAPIAGAALGFGFGGTAGAAFGANLGGAFGQAFR